MWDAAARRNLRNEISRLVALRSTQPAGLRRRSSSRAETGSAPEGQRRLAQGGRDVVVVALERARGTPEPGRERVQLVVRHVAHQVDHRCPRHGHTAGSTSTASPHA
jgi:hypothetical protein